MKQINLVRVWNQKKKNDNYICVRCKIQYSLLNAKCVYTPTLFDINFSIHYNYPYDQNFEDYIKSEITDKNYYFNRQKDYFPCKESKDINNNEDNPLYSCVKCYNIFEDEELDNYYFFHIYNDFSFNYYGEYQNYYWDDFYNDYYTYDLDLRMKWNLPTKVNDILMNNSYCIKPNEDVRYCLEAEYKISNNKFVYNCLQCPTNFKKAHNKDLDIYYCTYEGDGGICQVEYCESCLINNNNFCSSCITSEYEINFIGACIPKTESKPAVTWKDIYKLTMDSSKEINGKTINGPSFMLRGITCSKINSRHAFLVYLTFKIRHGLRSLKEQIDMPAICEIEKEVNETNISVNLVEYECIGNSTEKVNDDYELTSIQEDISNSGNIINGNLKEINAMISSFDVRKTEANFSEEDLDNIIIFNIEQIVFYRRNNTLYIDGKTNKKISKIRILSQQSLSLRTLTQDCRSDISIDLNISPEKEECQFCSDTENLKAKLTCNFAFKEGTDTSQISFENMEIKLGDNSIMLSQLRSDIIPINNEDVQNGKQIKESEDSDKSEEVINIPKFNKKKESSSNKTAIIIICVVAGIIGLGGLITGLIIYLRKRKINKVNVENNNITKSQISDSNKSDIELNKN